MRILVADDEEMKRVSLAADLAAWGHEVVACPDGETASAKLETALFDAVIADLKMPGMSGMELLDRIKAGPNAGCDVIMITAYGSIPVAVEAMRRGAFDFLTKPFSNEQLLPILQRIQRRQENSGQAAPYGAGRNDGPLIGTSPAMLRVLELVEICARTDSNVLICGETGTGKDLVASVIHKRSHRRVHPLVKVSCAVFPQELIASELYGHEKGAFTGADRARTGRLDLAAGGTLYLDDVDDVPLSEQVKLLRVLEERVYERVGGSHPVQADVRIIGSTKKDLLEEIERGGFRQDLYYRLNVMRIDLPPLRERSEDLPRLVDHLLQRISGMERVALAPEVIGVLLQHHWPGNVRELRNVLERCYLTGRGQITEEDVLRQLERQNGQGAPSQPHFRDRVDRFERDLVQRALQAAGGNKTAAARILGMKPSTFRDKLERLGL